jgi:hypothetical protein
VADRIARTNGRIEGAIRAVLTRQNLATAQRLYQSFRGAKITGSIAIALRR